MTKYLLRTNLLDLVLQIAIHGVCFQINEHYKRNQLFVGHKTCKISITLKICMTAKPDQ